MTINMTTKRRVVVENNDETDEEPNNTSDNEEQEPLADNPSSSDTNSDSDENTPTTNTAWADSISQILKTNKPKKKKTLVLSKAKKLNEVLAKKEKTTPAGYQIETKDGQIKNEEIKVENAVEETIRQPQKKRLKKKEISSLRTKPNILERDRERALSKIATRGVVQLFNSVRTQQKDIGKKLKEAGPLEVKKDKVLKEIDKRAFLDVLMGEKSQNVDTNVNDRVKSDGTWSVLRDDFMMGAKLKDWDKEMEGDEDEQEENEMEIEDE